ncbi:UNVERIFIED_ORG: hypothetical protein QOE_4630, partial [Clostridioides difficile F501]
MSPKPPRCARRRLRPASLPARRARVAPRAMASAPRCRAPHLPRPPR